MECVHNLIYRVLDDYASFNDRGIMVNVHGTEFALAELFLW
jgi:hypothetical protein